MKAYPPLLAAILLVAFLNFRYATSLKGEPVAKPTESGTISPTDTESFDVVAEGNIETAGEISAAKGASPITAEDFYERALEHGANKEFEEAIADCSEAIRLDPNNLQYRIYRAALNCDTRNLEQALVDVNKVLEADPNNLQGRLVRAKTLEASGEFEKALVEFNTAVERNPTSEQALLERHYYFTRQGQVDNATADADRLIQLQPQSPAGHVSRAMMHAGSADVDQVMNYVSSILQRDPENWEAYSLRAAVRSSKHDFTGAREDYETALKFSPDNAVVLNTRGIFYLQTGEYEKSLADMKRAAELRPEASVFKAAVADLLATCPDQRIRNGKKAAKYAADALKLTPHDPIVWSACAAAAAESGNFEEAINWQQRVINSTLTELQKAGSAERLEAYKASKPYRDTFIMIDKARLKTKEATDAINSGDFDRAVALLSEVIAADPENAETRTLRGIAYHGLKKHTLAIADLSAAIERNPKDGKAYYFRAHSLYDTKKYAAAIDDLEMLEKLADDKSTDLLNNLAWVFATCPDDQLRDGGKAAEYIDRALERDPNRVAIWDTCAAVFAENGEFDDAMEWEKAFIDSTEISEELRRDGEKRLILYHQHRAYREEPELASSNVTSSATPTQPEK